MNLLELQMNYTITRTEPSPMRKGMSYNEFKLDPDGDFLNMLEFGAYSYQNSLGGCHQSSWTQDQLRGFFKTYGVWLDRLTNYSNFGWTKNVQYIEF